MGKPHKVLIMRCDTYDPARIAHIVETGMAALDVRPEGRILLKPNVVIAHPEVFPHAFTRKEFLDGVISATQTRARNPREIAVRERSGITLPTRWTFKNAGYPEIQKHRIKARYFEEDKQVPGALQEAFHIYNGYYPDVTRQLRKIRYVVGRVEGPLKLDPDEKVIFAGNCTSWKGTIDGKPVRIKSRYRPPGAVDEAKTRSNDLLRKTFETLWRCFRHRKSRYIHARGCPVSVSDHVHYLSAVGRIPNVNFDPRMVVPLNLAYWQMRAHRLLNRWRH